MPPQSLGAAKVVVRAADLATKQGARAAVTAAVDEFGFVALCRHLLGIAAAATV